MRRCVATGWRICNVSLLDREQWLSCCGARTLEVRSADCMLHDGRSPKECESCQCDTSNGFWMVWCQPSNARRTQSLATRRTERWVVGTSLKSARAGIKHQWCKNKRCKHWERKSRDVWNLLWEYKRSVRKRRGCRSWRNQHCSSVRRIFGLMSPMGRCQWARQTRWQDVKLTCRFRNRLTGALNRERHGCWSFQAWQGSAMKLQDENDWADDLSAEKVSEGAWEEDCGAWVWAQLGHAWCCQCFAKQH